MAILSTNFPKGWLPFVGSWAAEAYKEQAKKYPEVFKEFNMTHRFEEDVMSYGAGLANIVGENEPFTMDRMGQAWSYIYRAYKYVNGFQISEEAIEDEKHHNLAKFRTKETAKSLNATVETVAADLINNAFDSGTTYGDGQPLISSSHFLSKSSETVANRPTNYSSMSETAIEQMWIDTQDYRDEANVRISAPIKALLIPTALHFEVARILESTKRFNTANNDANVLKDEGIIPKVICWNYLSDANAYFALLECEHGLKLGWRYKQKSSTDNDIHTGSMIFKFQTKFSVGVTDAYRAVYGSQGAI